MNGQERVGPGPALEPAGGEITVETIAEFARLSGDYNPLHFDQAYGRQTIYGGPIAQGPLSLDHLLQAICAWSGQAWPEGLRCRATFIAPVRAPSRVTARGRVVASDDAQTRLELQVETEDGTNVIVAQASLPLPAQE